MTIESDDEEDAKSYEVPVESSEDETVKAPKRSTGKLKSAKKFNKTQQPSPANSTQDAGSQKSPAKAKTSKSKSKTAVKEPPKANAKPIYSFFNAATQKLQNSQPSASPEKPSTQPSNEPEIIQDDSDSATGSGVHLSKGSSTALALRKRKVHDGHSFDNSLDLPPQASQKFRKATNGDRVPPFSALNEDKRPWTEQFGPTDLSELAVHRRKVADVRQWLETTLNGHRQRVLVLKSAAGAGKTTTVRLLARELDLEVSEWKNPAGADIAAEGSMSAALQFEEFVGRAGSSGGLSLVRHDGEEVEAGDSRRARGIEAGQQYGRILLAEEFPNTFSRVSSTLQSFRSTISQYLSSPMTKDTKPTPLVLVISETLLSTNTALADSFTAHRLLGPELMNHPFLTVIEFNAIAQTFLLKALETIVLKEARKTGRRRTPGPAVLKRLAESGDVRSAVSSLEFLCLRGDSEDIWSSKVTFTKQKKSKVDPPLTPAEEEALKLISNRESTLGIFHAVGKVVYNKRIMVPQAVLTHPPPWLPQHRRDKVPENDVDFLIDELGTDTSTFLAALHENYTLSCSSSSREEAMDSLTACMDCISDADLLSVDRFSQGTRSYSGGATDGLRQDEMAFQVSVRGLWFHLPYPVHRTVGAATDGSNKRDAHQMFYPASLKIWRRREEIEGLLQLLANDLQAGVFSDGAGHPTDGASGSASGVARWKQNTTFTSRSSESAAEGTSRDISNSAKTELLLERLPFVAQIISQRKVLSKLLERLNTVIKVRSSAPNDNDEEDEPDPDETNAAEQWTTDLPDVDSVSRPRKPKAKIAEKATKFTEAVGLGIPVENRVERLVLEDDDIED